jgi:glycerol-3-phosphate acyltransferase PlsX
MGGDYAPEEIVAGAVLAAQEYDAEIILVGDEARIQPLLTEVPPPRRVHPLDLWGRAVDVVRPRRNGAAGSLRVVHAPEAVPMEQSASQAVRQSEKTSLGIAVSMVKKAEADAVISAGNSGAFLAIAVVRLRTIPGIARPAIATIWPALKGPTVLLDSGANVDCRPEWLEQFAIMGSAYAKAVLHIQNPRVAILSVGEERSKGNQQVFEAAKLLESAPLNFIGNIEGKDMFRNVADVIVADGFIGNVVLKTSEGMISDLGRVVKEALLGGNIITKIGALMLAPALRSLRRRFDYETYGGAPLLGMRGNCIVTHGRASRNAIKHAIHAAIEEVRNDVVGKITESISLLASAPEQPMQQTGEMADVQVV